LELEVDRCQARRLNTPASEARLPRFSSLLANTSVMLVPKPAIVYRTSSALSDIVEHIHSRFIASPVRFAARALGPSARQTELRISPLEAAKTTKALIFIVA
jgi:hypothetical protein